MTELTVITPYYPSQSNGSGGIFVYDQVIEMGKFIDKVDIFVMRPLFYISRKFPFIKLNRENSKFLSSYRENVKVFELKYFPFPKDIDLYHKSISISLSFYKKYFSKKILIHTIYPLGVAANKINIKSSIVIHGTDLRYFINNKKQKVEIINALKKAQKVIVVSNGLGNEVMQLGINYNKIAIIENGIKIQQSINVEEKDDVFKFVFVGSLIMQKGVYELLSSFIEISKSIDNVELYFIGDGIEKKKLEDSSGKLLNKSIFFLGSISNNEVMQKLPLMDCLVLPSYKEGFGRVIIEMMSFGKPVISTYSGGPEYIINDECGLLVNPKDIISLTKAMEYVYENYNKYDSNKISEYVNRQYNLENQTKKTIKFIM